MKKLIAVIALLVLALGAHAAGLQAGAGASAGFFIKEMLTSLASPAVSSDTTDTHWPVGFTAFFDSPYVQANVGYSQSLLGHEKSTQTISGSTSTLVNTDIAATKGYLSIAVLGKYPLALGPVSLFPLIGLAVDFNVLAMDASGNDLKASMTDQQKADENQFWVKAGVGADVMIFGKAFIRPELIAGLKLPNGSERSAIASAQQAGFNALLLTFTFDFSLLVGYSF